MTRSKGGDLSPDTQARRRRWTRAASLQGGGLFSRSLASVLGYSVAIAAVALVLSWPLWYLATNHGGFFSRAVGVAVLGIVLVLCFRRFGPRRPGKTKAMHP